MSTVEATPGTAVSVGAKDIVIDLRDEPEIAVTKPVELPYGLGRLAAGSAAPQRDPELNKDGLSLKLVI